MEKSFATDDHAELLSAAGGKAVTFFDRSDRMTKSASDVISRQDLQTHMPPDDHFGIHLIATGSEQMFGPNRNGDSFSESALQKYHPSFEKFGCVYREHKNRDPRTQGIGQVKLARYNPKMSRGELIVWVSKDKAPDMYKQARDGKELSFSMSCRLPHDECSICRKKSKTTADYCKDLKEKMLSYVDEFQKYAYARNEEDVKFFDISEVKRRADRLATFLQYTFPGGEMAKAASANMIITGAQWAEHQFGPSLLVAFDPWEELTLEKLAAAEEFVRNADSETLATLRNMAPQSLSHEQVETLAAPDFRSVGGELAKRAMLLDFPTFASLITGRPIDELKKDAGFCDAMSVKLPTLMSDLFRSGGCGCGPDVADAVAPDDTGVAFSPGKDNIDRLMREVGGEIGMDSGPATDRAMRVTVIKSASVRQPLQNRNVDAYYAGMIDAYGFYAVKAAHTIKSLPNVSENVLLRSIAASLAIDPS